MTDQLSETRDFFAETLGLEVANYDESAGLLVLRLADGFVLRFESKGPATPETIRFLGLELGSFDEVDSFYDRLRGRVNIIEDLRPRFTTKEGPYGFIIEDPNGYRLKLFKYGPRVDGEA